MFEEEKNAKGNRGSNYGALWNIQAFKSTDCRRNEDVGWNIIKRRLNDLL